MILIELNEQDLKEEEKNLRKKFNFIVRKILGVIYYLFVILLIFLYIHLLNMKSKLEIEYSSNKEYYRLLENDIEIYKNLITTKSSIDVIKNKLKLSSLFSPSSVYYIYDSELVVIKEKEDGMDSR